VIKFELQARRAHAARESPAEGGASGFAERRLAVDAVRAGIAVDLGAVAARDR